MTCWRIVWAGGLGLGWSGRAQWVGLENMCTVYMFNVDGGGGTGK